MINYGKPQKIGVMGGTFDPVHFGHLVTAEAALSEFNLDRVLFVPSGQPPHKNPNLVGDSEHRYLMTICATLTNPAFDVSRVEIERTGATYTVDTLRLLQQEYGSNSHLYFITGADVIADVMNWKNSVEVLSMAGFIAATRPGYHFPECARQWFLEHGKELHEMEVPAMAISSTDIRQRIKAGKPIRYLVPESVEYYIRKNGLYLTAAPDNK